MHTQIQARNSATGRERQSIVGVAHTVGVVYQTLFNWVKAQYQDRLACADSWVKTSPYTPATKLPDLPPCFSSSLQSVMVMPRSTALHMS